MIIPPCTSSFLLYCYPVCNIHICDRHSACNVCYDQTSSFGVTQCVITAARTLQSMCIYLFWSLQISSSKATQCVIAVRALYMHIPMYQVVTGESVSMAHRAWPTDSGCLIHHQHGRAKAENMLSSKIHSIVMKVRCGIYAMWPFINDSLILSLLFLQKKFT